MQPAADTIPPSAPLTRATVSADARQEPATAAHKFEDAPGPIGKKTIRRARNPMRDRATRQRSLRTLGTSPMNRLLPLAVCRSGTNGRAKQQSVDAAPSTAPAIHAPGRCFAIHNPAPYFPSVSASDKHMEPIKNVHNSRSVSIEVSVY